MVTSKTSLQKLGEMRLNTENELVLETAGGAPVDEESGEDIIGGASGSGVGER